jgi:uncharacterized protein (TIGR00369 family)
MNDHPVPLLEIPHGFGQLVGYRLAVWRPDYAEVVLPIEPQHLNRSQVPHGGLLVTMIDTAAGYAGCYCAEPGRVRRAVTLSLTTSFIAAAMEGAILTAKARRTGGGRSIYFARCELVDDAGRLIATGEGSFKYRRGSEDPKGVPA